MFEGKSVKLKALEQNDLIFIRQWKRPVNLISSIEYEILEKIYQKNYLRTISSANPPKEIVFGIFNKKNILIGISALTQIDWKNHNSKMIMYMPIKYTQKTNEAHESVMLLLKYSFDELNLHRLYIEFASFTTTTIKLFQKLKFTCEGEFVEKYLENGKWCNTIVFSKLHTEYVYD